MLPKEIFQLSIREKTWIEVELVGREHATTQQEVIQKIFWQTSLAFQVYLSPTPARQTRDRLLPQAPTTPLEKVSPHFQLDYLYLLPYPPSFSTPTALISYTLHAVVYISEFPFTRSISHTATELDILSKVGDASIKKTLGPKEASHQVICGDEHGREVL
uniref:Uncharacterized protein n=1 Tax=Kwoniella bestiolae CBS 10118 TaxID=1296100 RepID=A0A1B9GF15_9TREE|nr:hypothetical protein I302_01079 [Kwoniella bestiolae CBS 10118]OCF29571.1 hypothetical protein I302_01079 [Kwoniella bestiolae CBS 10118]